jgi:hypothetical protein
MSVADPSGPARRVEIVQKFQQQGRPVRLDGRLKPLEHTPVHAFRVVSRFAHPSRAGIVGIPLPSEKRVVTGIVLPLNSAARLKRAPLAEPLKVPSTTTPLA